MQAISEVKIDIDVTRNSGRSIFTKSIDTKTRFVTCRIFDGEKLMNLEGCQAKVYALKPDNTKVFNSCEITDAEKGEVTFEITNQMSAVPGLVKCELEILGENTESLSTPKFYLNVDETLRDDSAIESSNEFSALTEAINKVGDFAAISDSASAAAGAAQEAAHSASQAAARAEQAVNGFVPDGSVTAETVAGARANLFDKSKATEADIQTDGTALPAEGYLCTDFIPVRPGSTYTFPAGHRRHIALFDKNKNFLRYIDGGTSEIYDAPLTIPTDIPEASAVWLRISYHVQGYALNADNFMICIGKKYYEDYLPFGDVNVNWVNREIPEDSVTSPKIKNGSVTEEKIENGCIGREKIKGSMRNILNLDDFESGKLNVNGTVAESKDDLASDFIEVKSGETYSLSPKYAAAVCSYDIQKNFIGTTTDKVIKVADNAAFLRVGYAVSAFSSWNLMLCEGSTYPDCYIPFGCDYVPWLERNPLTGKKLLVFGDSIFEYYKCYPNTVGIQNNMNFVRANDNKSMSGTTVAKLTTPDGTSFVERFKALIGAGGAWENEKPDYLILDGGINDCRLGVPIGSPTGSDDFNGELNESATCGALETILRLAQAKWAGCFIGYCTSYKIPALPGLQRYFEATKAVCAKYGVPVLDLYSTCGFNIALPEVAEKYMQDDLHINALGHLKLAAQLEAFMRSRGGSCTAVPPVKSPITNTASGSSITLTDSAAEKIRGFKIYGRSTQDGTPSPDNPAPIVSIGDNGNIAVTSSRNLDNLKGATQVVLLAEPLRSLPNGVCDVYDNGLVTRKIKKIVLDGTQEIDQAGAHADFVITVPDAVTLGGVSCMCETLPCYSAQELSERKDEDGFRGVANVGGWIRIIDHTLFEEFTVDDFKNYLIANPITVYYQTSEEYTEQAAPINLPTYYPITNISNDENADMEVEYPADTKNYIDCKISELSMLIPTPDVIPDWEQPETTYGYSKGDKVRYNGKVYESLIDNNVWHPLDYPAGWKVLDT